MRELNFRELPSAVKIITMIIEKTDKKLQRLVDLHSSMTQVKSCVNILHILNLKYRIYILPCMCLTSQFSI